MTAARRTRALVSQQWDPWMIVHDPVGWGGVVRMHASAYAPTNAVSRDVCAREALHLMPTIKFVRTG